MDIPELAQWAPREEVCTIHWCRDEVTRVLCGCKTRLLVPSDGETVVKCETCGQRYRATKRMGWGA